MEKWDLYDICRQKLDKTIDRRDAMTMSKDLYHLVIHVCIFNDKDQMLIQQRSKDKLIFANGWDVSVGGSVISGETPQQAAMRETKEELGIDIDLNNTRNQLSLPFENGFDDFFIVEKNVDIDDVILQIEEVQAVKWVSKSEILEMILNKEFVPYHESFVNLLFDMRGQYNGPFRKIL